MDTSKLPCGMCGGEFSEEEIENHLISCNPLLVKELLLQEAANAMKTNMPFLSDEQIGAIVGALPTST